MSGWVQPPPHPRGRWRPGCLLAVVGGWFWLAAVIALSDMAVANPDGGVQAAFGIVIAAPVIALTIAALRWLVRRGG